MSSSPEERTIRPDQQHRNTRSQARRLGAALLVLLVLCAVVFALHTLVTRLYLGEWTFPFDDPWIHQVYARNLAHYGQYAFNLGEPSTGSSAPLWTFLLAPAYLLGLSPIAWTIALGLICLAALGAISWEWAGRHYSRPLPLLLTIAVVFSPQIAWTGVEGMETALVAALGLFILRRQDRPAQGSMSFFRDGLLHGLFLWLRPEGPLLTLATIWGWRRKNWRKLLAFGAGFLLLAGPYAGFHWALSGRPLPQTVYAKIAYYGGPISLSSLGSFFQGLVLSFAPGLWGLVLILLVLSIRWMIREKRWVWGTGLLWAGLTFLVAAIRLPIVVHFGRHFVPVLPVLILASGEAIERLPRLGRQAIFLLGGSLLLIGMILGVVFYVGNCERILDSQIAMGKWIAENLPPAESVATHDVGAIGFFGHHRVVDTLALITPELTPVVAASDTTALLVFLSQQQVHHLATLEQVYPEIEDLPDIQRIVRLGNMQLLRLP
jgi:hypothetical protein